MMAQNKLEVFQGTEVRRAWHDDEWCYSLVDIISVLSASKNPTDYLKKIRKRDEELKTYLGTNCPQVEMQTTSGKKRKILAGNTKDIFRLIQSIPSKKAEPFKQWLAQVGKVAGNARKETEKELESSIISKKNFLATDDKKRLKE